MQLFSLVNPFTRPQLLEMADRANKRLLNGIFAVTVANQSSLTEGIDPPIPLLDIQPVVCGLVGRIRQRRRRVGVFFQCVGIVRKVFVNQTDRTVPRTGKFFENFKSLFLPPSSTFSPV